MADYQTEPMLDLFVFEAGQLLEQLEQVVLASESRGCFDEAAIDEIFRVMHTIKGAAAMMVFDNIAALAHGLEDVFHRLRERKAGNADYSELADRVLAGGDFIKNELEKIKAGREVDGDAAPLLASLGRLTDTLDGVSPQTAAPAAPGVRQQYYIPQKKQAKADRNHFSAVVFFQDDCGMENIRAYTIVNGLREFAADISFVPADIIENDETAELIGAQGFTVHFATARDYQEVEAFFQNTICLEKVDLQMGTVPPPKPEPSANPGDPPDGLESGAVDGGREAAAGQQRMISVSVGKLDKLMDLVGELVLSAAMVTQNPDLRGLELDSFRKAARQLNKITDELQDTVMAVRMVPLAPTFHKLNRLVRDMGKKLDKQVQLVLLGEDTEVDKNIIEHISDPLMHLIRNALDHGLEPGPERIDRGKPAAGRITLEARNAGSEVLIVIKDDGRGLDKAKILARARNNGLIRKPEAELSDKEIYSFIFLPGFSTKQEITEFSGRGVGLDVVTKNVNRVGGVVVVDSEPGQGTTVILKIPLTLAIIDGLTVGVGDALFTVPITAIRESFRPQVRDLVTDPDGNEMIMVRGDCHPVLRLHRRFEVKNAVTELAAGIMMMVETDGQRLGIFADRLLGEQQVVVKALPRYIKALGPAGGLAGCTILGDGGISLILDATELMQHGYGGRPGRPDQTEGAMT